MATRTEIKVFGLKDDADALRKAAKVVRRRGWEPKFARALNRLAEDVAVEAAELERGSKSRD